MGAAPVGAFKAAWRQIVAEDRAGCQAYFLQLRDMRQALEDVALSVSSSVESGSAVAQQETGSPAQDEAEEAKKDEGASNNSSSGNRAHRDGLDAAAAAAAMDSAGDAMDVTAPGDGRAAAQNEEGEVDELIRSLEYVHEQVHHAVCVCVSRGIFVTRCDGLPATTLTASRSCGLH